MNTGNPIGTLDAATLTAPVQRALSSTTAQIEAWEYQPISYVNTEAANLGLHRFAGTAQDRDAILPWSVVLKVVHAPANDANPAFWNYHRREILAYQSGLLDTLPGGLSAPRCLGITEHPEDVWWLWLEDLAEPTGRRWSIADYAAAARDLGLFNGAYAAGHPLPTAPWLSRGFLRGWLGFFEADFGSALQLLRNGRTWEHPVLRGAFQTPISDQALQLWDRRGALLEALDRLPQAFCHYDAYQPNLFRRRLASGAHQTVAIDWVFAGVGALGEEIANLVAASMIFLQQDAASAKVLEAAVLESYLDGLQAAGWRGDPRLVRLGYLAGTALRWGTVGWFWLEAALSAEMTADLEKQWGHPLPEMVSQWAPSLYYVFGCAEEAYQFQHVLLDDLVSANRGQAPIR